MTVSERLPEVVQTNTGTIKLRINLTAPKAPPVTVEVAETERSTTGAKSRRNNRETAGAVLATNSNNGGGSPDARQRTKNSKTPHHSTPSDEPATENSRIDTNVAPLRLKLTLKGPSSGSSNKPPPAPVLPVKKLSEAGEPSVDIETVEHPAKRRRLPKPQKADKEPSIKYPYPSRGPAIAAGGAGSNNPYSTIAAVKPAASLAGPKVPLPAFRPNMTRVPIAALSSFSSMTPGEREEERLWRQSLAETLGSLWSLVTKPGAADKAPEGAKGVIEASVAYWLMFSPIDSALNAPTLRPAPVENLEERAARIEQEYVKLKAKFDAFSLADKNKEIATELLVLEQKLCLEEEKFLFAKLKSDYNAKVVEIMAKKRQSESASPASSTSAPASAPSLLPGGAPNAHQRILPKKISSSDLSHKIGYRDESPR